MSGADTESGKRGFVSEPELPIAVRSRGKAQLGVGSKSQESGDLLQIVLR